MPVALAERLVILLAVYVALGLLFAVPFALGGVRRIDPAAREGTWGFRIIILPGVVALWPLLVGRWLRGAAPPEENNAHRRAARHKSRS